MPLELRTSFQPPRPSTPPPSSPIDYTQPPNTRLVKATQWIKANISETCTTASRLLRVNYKTLYSAINRSKLRAQGGNNKSFESTNQRYSHLRSRPFGIWDSAYREPSSSLNSCVKNSFKSACKVPRTVLTTYKDPLRYKTPLRRGSPSRNLLT
jgi:hypothetical protein